MTHCTACGTLLVLCARRYCKACLAKRTYPGRAKRQKGDLTPAEIERRYAAAYAEIRARRRRQAA